MRGRFPKLLLATLAVGLIGCPEKPSGRHDGEEVTSSPDRHPRIQTPRPPVRRHLRDRAVQAEKAVSHTPWASPAECKKAWARARRRKERRPPTQLRVASWNLEWFPDTRPGKRAAHPGTDLAWTACLVSLLDADVVAVQESKSLLRAKRSWERLSGMLEKATGRHYEIHLDDCPDAATQHVGLLVDVARVQVIDQKTVGSLNPHGVACKNALRPGLAADLKMQNGLPVRVVSMHLKAGTKRRSLELRKATWANMVDYARTSGLPLLFAGDFNTMGCSHCRPRVSAKQELNALRDTLSAAHLRLVDVKPSCSHYFRGEAGLLDGFAVARQLATGSDAQGSGLRAQVHGPCDILNCAPAQFGALGFSRTVSDHCPISLDLTFVR